MYMLDNIGTAGALACAIVVYVIYTAVGVLRSPLSTLPGPWYTKWTSLVVNYHWLKGQRAFYVHELHQQYGPCVRVAPTEVHFADIDTLKTVYSSREVFTKSLWYKRFATARPENIFSTSNVELHRRYRRLMSAAMSESSLASHQDQIRSIADQAVARMAEEMKSRGAADVSKWWLFMTADSIGELAFGESFGAIKYGKKTGYLADLGQLGPLATLRTLVPSLVPIGMILRVPVLIRAAQAGGRIRAHATDSLASHERLRQAEPEKARQTLIAKISNASEDGHLTFEEMVVNAQAYVIAGIDTTAGALTYLVWCVCSRPEVRKALVQELNSLPDDFRDPELKALSYLNNVINETLRLHGTAPSALPRIVPEGGATLAGHYIPEGTTVCCQAYSLHRDPKIWPDPETFTPDRWNDTTKEMRDSFMPFGAGARICIGLNLARMELRYAVARFFLTFPNAKMSIREGMSDAVMEPRIYFLQKMTGDQCLVEAS